MVRGGTDLSDVRCTMNSDEPESHATHTNIIQVVSLAPPYRAFIHACILLEESVGPPVANPAFIERVVISPSHDGLAEGL